MQHVNFTLELWAGIYRGQGWGIFQYCTGFNQRRNDLRRQIKLHWRLYFGEFVDQCQRIYLRTGRPERSVRTRFDTWDFDAACDQGFVRTPLSNWIEPKQREQITYVDLKIRPKWSQARAISGYRAPLSDGVHAIRYDDGTRFEGEIKNGKANGHGVMTWLDGDQYDGNWKNGDKTGRGVMKWNNGDHYVGDFQANLANGHGVMVLANGDSCDGEWRDSKLVGTGAGIQGQSPKICYPQKYRFTFDQP
jgi:hypothetical protein